VKRPWPIAKSHDLFTAFICGKDNSPTDIGAARSYFVIIRGKNYWIQCIHLGNLNYHNNIGILF